MQDKQAMILDFARRCPGEIEPTRAEDLALDEFQVSKR